jgi:hypothetical protein
MEQRVAIPANYFRAMRTEHYCCPSVAMAVTFLETELIGNVTYHRTLIDDAACALSVEIPARTASIEELILWAWSVERLRMKGYDMPLQWDDDYLQVQVAIAAARNYLIAPFRYYHFRELSDERQVNEHGFVLPRKQMGRTTALVLLVAVALSSGMDVYIDCSQSHENRRELGTRALDYVGEYEGAPCARHWGNVGRLINEVYFYRDGTRVPRMPARGLMNMPYLLVFNPVTRSRGRGRISESMIPGAQMAVARDE